MNKHIHAQHTARDKMKYKCDHCGKGFSESQKLNDHVNIHTGEKPHKCKFCSACFAIKGNHAQHEKSHLGQKRNYGKK
jgi:KRAB domain-containing zinc finger protein